jgi:hypothetical protein
MGNGPKERRIQMSMNITQFPDNTNVVTFKLDNYSNVTVNQFFGEVRLNLKDVDGNEVRISFESKLAFGLFLDNLCNAQDGKVA